jgi:hypothetical protein
MDRAMQITVRTSKQAGDAILLMDALAALDLELVIRPRSSVAADEIETLF